MDTLADWFSFSFHDHVWPSDSHFLQGLRMVSTWAIGGRTIKTCPDVGWGCSFRAVVQYTSWISFHGTWYWMSDSILVKHLFTAQFGKVSLKTSHIETFLPALCRTRMKGSWAGAMAAEDERHNRQELVFWWLMRAAVGSWAVRGGFVEWGITSPHYGKSSSDFQWRYEDLWRETIMNYAFMCLSVDYGYRNEKDSWRTLPNRCLLR